MAALGSTILNLDGGSGLDVDSWSEQLTAANPTSGSTRLSADAPFRCLRPNPVVRQTAFGRLALP